MSDGSIEILGQKFSYPTSWPGAAAVFAVCVSLSVIAFVAKSWATPENMNNLVKISSDLKDVARYSGEQGSRIDNLSKDMDQLKNQISGINGAAPNTAAAGTDQKTINEIAQIKDSIALSNLNEQVASQNILKSQTILPIIYPKDNFQEKIQQYEGEKVEQQKIQEQLSSRLRDLQEKR